MSQEWDVSISREMAGARVRCLLLSGRPCVGSRMPGRDAAAGVPGSRGGGDLPGTNTVQQDPLCYRIHLVGAVPQVRDAETETPQSMAVRRGGR